MNASSGDAGTPGAGPVDPEPGDVLGPLERPVGEGVDVAVDQAHRRLHVRPGEQRLPLEPRLGRRRSARSTRSRSAWAEAITPRTLGVPAAYFQGSWL